MTVFKKDARSVSNRGAKAGSVLCGFGMSNSGIRLKVSEEQVRGHDGPIQGSFVLLDAGDNVHSQALGVLLHRVTDAAEVLAIIRRQHPGCVSVANANILVPEPPQEPGTQPDQELS